MFVKIYGYVNEASKSENKNSSEIGEQNGTTCRYARSKIEKFIKIRIPLAYVPKLPHMHTSLLPNVREITLICLAVAVKEMTAQFLHRLYGLYRLRQHFELFISPPLAYLLGLVYCCHFSFNVLSQELCSKGTVVRCQRENGCVFENLNIYPRNPLITKMLFSKCDISLHFYLNTWNNIKFPSF